MTHQRWNIPTLLRQKGYRVTSQRLAILDAVCEGNGHTTADAIFRRVLVKYPTVNRATIYRTLEFLCQLRLVVAADIGDGRLVYEIAGERPHHHLICQNCGAVELLDNKTVKPWFELIEKENKFFVDMDHLTLFGLCRECRNTK